MKYLQKFEETTVSINLEEGDSLVISTISNQFKKEDIITKIQDENDETDKHSALIDMIIWYQDNFGKDIENEDEILKKLRDYYNIH